MARNSRFQRPEKTKTGKNTVNVLYFFCKIANPRIIGSVRFIFICIEQVNKDGKFENNKVLRIIIEWV